MCDLKKVFAGFLGAAVLGTGPGLALAGGCPAATVPVVRGAARLTEIASIPVYDAGASVHYSGSIDPDARNHDHNWGEVQDENGEWILMEDLGPGCIYNFVQHRGETSEVPVYRFYFDGAKKAQVELKPRDFGAKHPVPAPLGGALEVASEKFRIVRSFVPMEYRKSVRVTSSVALRGSVPGGGWGHVMWQKYDTDKGLRTFDASNDLSPLVAAYSGELAVPHDGEAAKGVCEVPADGGLDLYASAGRGTIVGIELAGAVSLTNGLRNLWMTLEFDGRRTCVAPIATFFGCETPGRPAKLMTALITFDFSDGRTLRLSNRFPMPFFRSARVRLENRGKTPVKLDGATVRTNGQLRYPEKNTGLFTATEYLPRTVNKQNVNAHIGRFVGRGLMAYGVVTGCFLHGNACEGDVRCFIDDMTTPRVQSDGSESWGAWGWGFHFPPQVSPFSCYHAVNDHKNSRYCWSLLRLTFADAYNFRRFLRFDIEHGEFNDQPDSAHSGQCFGYLIYDHD